MPVTVKTARDVSPAIKKVVSRAEAAIQQKNWGYAFDILRDVLLKEPGFNDARFLLREAQLDKIGRQTSLVRQSMAALSTAWAINVAGPKQLKKGNFAEALNIAEKAMEADPTALPILKYLAKAAIAAGLPDVAINALEVAVEYHPKSAPTIKELAELYEAQKMGTKAVATWQKLTVLQPNNLQAQSRLKGAAALATMEQARWEEEGDFTGKLRTPEQQTILELERSGARDAEGRVRLINAYVEELEKKPDSVSTYRKLADLYHQNGNFDEAIECYGRITDLTQTRDPSIESAITTVMQDKYNSNIRDLQEQLKSEPDKAEAISAAIEEMENERDNTLLARYQQRVENYPNEAQFRMDLGELLHRFQRVDEALEQYQHAQRSAHLAPAALHAMGQCFREKGLVDLAIEHYRNALTHRERMRPGLLKDTLYDLALAYEAKEDPENALATLKELYSLDVSFRDVAERIEKSYKS